MNTYQSEHKRRWIAPFGVPFRVRSSSRHFKDARSGTTLAELMVAGFLLITGMSLVAQGVVRSYRMHQELRHYQLAHDELANQIELLTSKLAPLSLKERSIALKSVQVTEPIQTILAPVKLSAELVPDESRGGDWLRLTMDWERGGPSVPLSLVGWVRSTTEQETSP